MDISEKYTKMCDCPEVQHAKTSTERDGYSFHVNLPHPKYGDEFKRVTWLPRQDQIQEMMIDFAMDESIYNWKCHTPTMKLFSLFVIFCEVNGAKYETFEQLWLAFYMYEKHKKTWNGEKWIKS